MIKSAADILAEIAALEEDDEDDKPEPKRRGRPRVKSPVCVEDGCEEPSVAYERCKTHKTRYQNSPEWRPIPPCPAPGCARKRLHKVLEYNRRTWHRNKPQYVTAGAQLMVWTDEFDPIPVNRRRRTRNMAMKTRLEVMRRLLLARKAEGLTQWEVAFRMGRTQSLISDMERGVSGVNMNNLQQYAKAIGLRMTAGYDLVERSEQ